MQYIAVSFRLQIEMQHKNLKEQIPHIQSNTPSGSLQQYRDLGKTIAEWSADHGFNTKLVYAILRDERKCLRGESFRIAKALGMK